MILIDGFMTGLFVGILLGVVGVFVVAFVDGEIKSNRNAKMFAEYLKNVDTDELLKKLANDINED